MLTATVRRMLLNLPAQLGNVFPAAGASCIVQLGDVARRLLALGGLLRKCEQARHAENDVGDRGSQGAEGARTTMVLGICLSQ